MDSLSLFLYNQISKGEKLIEIEISTIPIHSKDLKYKSKAKRLSIENSRIKTIAQND